jgi:metal transporter CNNM
MDLVHIATWVGIFFCLSQSAMFSGMNLAAFSISRLRLEVQVAAGNRLAQKTLALRRDANFLLATILWGNVGINVLLTLLSDSVMTGVLAFCFSTILITLVGEIMPQAYFSRHALKMAALLAPLLKFYQLLLYPLAKPMALLLDRWLGPEGIYYFRERDLREVIKMHMAADEAEVDHVEGAGALNFLAIDDLTVIHEGEPVDPQSVIQLEIDAQERPIFPEFEHSAADAFLRQIERSEKKWVILTDPGGGPRLVLDADGFLRQALFHQKVNPYAFCHRPIVVHDLSTSLGEVMRRLKVNPQRPGDDVIDQDIILIWGEAPIVITGADLLGRLMRGIIRITAEGKLAHPQEEKHGNR